MASIVEYILKLRGEQFQSGIALADSSTKALDASFSKLQSTIGMTFGLAGAGLFAKSMVDAGSKIEDVRIGLSTLLKDSQQAQRVIGNTMEDAMRTPFDFESLLGANKALISAGVSAKQSREDVLNLANAIAATGGGNDELQRMVINLQQIKNTGDATAMDIRQFAYAGVNMYALLDAAGIKVDKTNKEQVITYNQITSALKKAHEEGGMFYNGLENMAGNTSVQISNLGDAIFQLKVKIFEDLKPAITSTVENLKSLIEKLGELWKWAYENRDAIKALAAGYIAYRVAMGGVLQTMSSLLSVTSQVGGATSSLIGTLTGGGGLISALGAVGVAIGAVTGLYVYAIQKQNEFYEKQQNLHDYTSSNNDARLQQDMMGDLMYLKTELGKKYQGSALNEQIYSTFSLGLTSRTEVLKNRLLQSKSLDEELKIQKELSEISDKERVLSNMKVDNFKALNSQGGSNNTSGLVAAQKSSKPPTQLTPRAVGSKAVTINVHINDLVKEMKVNITNFKQDAYKLKDAVEGLLIGAINDSQIIADR